MAAQESRKASFLRQAKYKELFELGSKIEATIENEPVVQTLKKICVIAKHADELCEEGSDKERLDSTREAVLDSQIQKINHELLGTVVQKLDRVVISDDEFVAAINRTIGPNKDWEKLANIAVKMSKTITFSQSLYGTFDVESVIKPKPQKEKKERRKNKAAENTQQTKPISVKQQRKEEQEALTVNVVGTQIAKVFHFVR